MKKIKKGFLGKPLLTKEEMYHKFLSEYPKEANNDYYYPKRND